MKATFPFGTDWKDFFYFMNTFMYDNISISNERFIQSVHDSKRKQKQICI